MLNLRTYLGLPLEELRNWAHMTREEAARAADLDPRQIADYELYGVWLEPESLSRLVDGLGADIRDAFDFKGDRIRRMLPLEERLAKRGVERSDKGRTRKPPQGGAGETA